MHEGVNEQIPFVSYPRRFGKIGLSLFVFVQGFLPCRVFFFGLSLGLHTPPFLRVISYSTRPDAMCTLFCRRDMLHAVFLTDDDLEEELEKRQGHGVRCAHPQVVFFFFFASLSSSLYLSRRQLSMAQVWCSRWLSRRTTKVISRLQQKPSTQSVL